MRTDWLTSLRSAPARRKHTRLLPCAAEVCEPRVLLSANGRSDQDTVIASSESSGISPSASDDYFEGPHDMPLGGNVLNNDDPGWDFSISLDSDAQSGQLTLNPDGSFDYIPDAGWVGTDSFTYSISNDYGSDTATVTIVIGNSAPEFWPVAEYIFGAEDLDPDFPLFYDGDILGQLQADDMDPLTFGGSNAFLGVKPDTGEVVVTDGAGLTEYFRSSSPLELAVSVTDGIETVMSGFVLGKHTGFMSDAQSQLYVLDTAGNEYTPENADGLIDAFETIVANGDMIDYMIIKGHGDIDLGTSMQVGDGGEWLTVSGTSILIGSEDVTNLWSDATNANSEIYLRGCNTYFLAKDVAFRLEGTVPVYGSIGFILGIPGTTWAFGIYAGH